VVVPTYFLACRIIEDAGFYGRIRGVTEDIEGVDTTVLRAGLERAEKEALAKGNTEPKLKPPHPWNKRYKHLIYCVPTFSNPSGRTMSIRRRETLVRLAREFDALIVSDDVYDHLSWPHTARADLHAISFPRHAIAPRLVDVDRFLDGGVERAGSDDFGNTISQGTFSKLAGPGCRTGWAEGTPKAMYGLSQVGSSRSGGAPSGLVATFMAEMLRRGTLQAWIRDELQPELAVRCQRLRSAIQELLVPLGVQFLDEGHGVTAQEFEGGYFIAIQLPKGVSATSLAEHCKNKANCIIAPGPAFAVWGDDHAESIDLSRMVRLCFSWEQENSELDGEHMLREGVQRIADVLATMLNAEVADAPTQTGNQAGFAIEDS
jgi:DNA-binding transcriptional MocR family regulator